MGSDFKKAITSSVIRLLFPLVKFLLRNSIPYGTFCELAKWVYVDVAAKDFSIPGRKQTVSRVAILTGLSRKEVSRVKDIAEPDDLGAAERYNRAIRVISGWRRDPRFLNNDGTPKLLSLDEGETSFSSLVKFHSGDIPARAILDELLLSGIVEMKNGKIRLLDEGYIVKTGEIEKIHILGTDVGELISAIDHNIDDAHDEAFLQRKIHYDNIPEDALIDLRKAIKQKSEKFIESMDRLMSGFDRDVNPSAEGKGRKKAGLGIYYFE
jgi:hypothetical protein